MSLSWRGNYKVLILFWNLLLPLSLFAQEMYDPVALYLTWQRSPQTTMTIQWITSLDRPQDVVEYQASGSEAWQKAQGNHIRMPDGHSFLIHRVELTNLTPETEYKFRTGFDAFEYKFHTLANELKTPLLFAAGGDIYHDDISYVEQMNKTIAQQNPEFVLVGGDIAYSFPHRWFWFPESLQRWLNWLMTWKKTMITTDGRLIPMLTTIGNHDVKGFYNQTPAQAPFFYALFAMPGPQGYNVLDLGSYLSIFILDSGHTHPIDGEQQQWLQRVMAERKGIPHKFALYHVPAYPSVRHFDFYQSSQIRKYWVPIFENYGLTAAFEHHDHAYKRTFPILNGKVEKNGVVYLGDGGWGIAEPRQPKAPSQTWYLAKTSQSRNVMLVTLFPGNKRLFRSIDPLGQTIDEYSQP